MYGVEPSDLDYWAHRLIHRQYMYATLVLVRNMRASGRITESDRSVIIALSDRLSAHLAQWYDISSHDAE